MAEIPSLQGLLAGDRRALAKAITLVESKRSEDRERANELIEQILPRSGNSYRIGISGVPGVGKSTFIEAFGLYLIAQGKRVAVLAVDPSSPVGGGSILGDKTRMTSLSRAPQAFIRPSPSSGIMGGIAQRTRETILLCEAAGYDVVLVETVGVGQSEVEVHGMVDFFMLLMVPNAGDELQGIKRGITELVDAIVINKADGESIPLANQARSYYQSAFDMLRGHDEYKPRVLTCSALEKTRLDDIWQMVSDYFAWLNEGDRLSARRRHQSLAWMKRLVNMEIERRLGSSELADHYHFLESEVSAGKITPLNAAEQVVAKLLS